MNLDALRRFLGRKTVSAARRRARLTLESLEGRWVPSTVTVGPGQSINAALAGAHPGDTIQVSPGTYTEAVTVARNSSGQALDGVRLQASAGVTIKSPAALTGFTVGTGSAAYDIGAALIDIQGANNVQVSGFTVDGSSNTDGNLAAGVRVIGGGSATVTGNTVIGLTTTNNPSAFGIGVQVGTHRGGGSAGTAKVVNNAISNYLDDGVLIDGAGSAATVQGNTITGQGVSAAEPQYGVQVSNSASARVEFNAITANNFHNDPNTVAAGVLVYATGGKQTVVARNTIDSNQTGVYVWVSSRAQVLSNDITNSGNSGGVVLDTSNNDTVKDNNVCGSAGDGIDLYSAGSNTVSNNDVHNASQDGVYFFASDNNSLNNNEVFCNGGNGVHLEASSSNTANDTDSFGNGLSGVYILGGQADTVKCSDSAFNIQDGVRLENTQSDSILGTVIALNGGAGVRLINAQNTVISHDIIVANAGGNVVADSASKGTVIDNSIVGPRDARECIGAAAVTQSWQCSVADSDAATAGL
jgi:parallel beta-helix repeat protein